MEKRGRKGKQREQEYEKATRKEKRSPLQYLNGHPICKALRKNSSNPFSSAASSSVEAPRGCLRLLPSSNSFSSSSSTRTLFQENLKDLPKLGDNERKNSSKMVPRTKENKVPRKPLLQKSKMIQPQGVKNATGPIDKDGHQRSKLSSGLINPGHELKKGPQEFQLKRGKSNLSSTAENYTPVGKVAPSCNLDSKNSGGHKHATEHVNNNEASSNGNNSGSDVKTPPVEASLSPEIQRSHSKIMVLNSGVTPTPVCYGISHLLSGVTDNRKCRRRGSLRGGSERVNLFNGEPTRDSLVPLPAEASVRWLLSPCREDLTNRLGQCSGSDLNTPDLLSSPSLLCGDASDLLSANSCYSDSDSVGDRIRNKNMVDSIRKATEFKGLLGPLNAVDEPLMASSPDALIGDNSVLSLDSLGSGNIIQTPSSDGCVEGSRCKFNHCNVISPELDSIAEILKRVNLSPRSDLGGLTEYEKNVDSVSSWASDSVLDAVGLSQMKISWRDRLASKNEEADEEINNGKSPPRDGKPVKNEENGSGREMDISPIVSEHEPCISAKGEEKLLSHVADVCAESICTDGGGLVASDDLDWMYSLNSHFYLA